MVSPAARVAQQLSRLEGLRVRSNRAWRQIVRHARERLHPLVRTLNAVSPLATLDRGLCHREYGGRRDLARRRPRKAGHHHRSAPARGRLRAKVEEST